MKKNCSKIFVAAFVTLFFTVTVSGFSANEGWNMISVGSQGDDIDYTKDSISEKCELKTSDIYHLDGETYSSVSELEPHKGYWVELESDCDLNLQNGDTAGISGGNLQSGWNMISVGSQSDNIAYTRDKIQEQCDLANEDIYHLDGETYSSVSELEPAKGYWIETAESCSLKLSGGGSEVPGTPDDEEVEPEELDDDIYFFDTEADNGEGAAIVGNGADDVTDETYYDMADARIKGRFVSEDMEEGRSRTLRITNEETGISDSIIDAKEYLRFPEYGSDNFKWGPRQSGVRELVKGEENEIHVEVLKGEDVISEETFTFDVGTEVPDSGGSSSGKKSCYEFSGSNCPSRCGTAYSYDPSSGGTTKECTQPRDNSGGSGYYYSYS